MHARSIHSFPESGSSETSMLRMRTRASKHQNPRFIFQLRWRVPPPGEMLVHSGVASSRIAVNSAWRLCTG